jgi:predicted nucleotide-binding protein (sugar kinase/HSP70/actin superfamily)
MLTGQFRRNRKKWIIINKLLKMKDKLKKIFKKENDPLTPEDKLKLIESSSKLVGPGVFY